MSTRSRGDHSRERRRSPLSPAPARPRERSIAVIGAGASGTLTAVNLLRRGRVRVTLIDPKPHGPGVAYSTRDESHLLNVPAAAMSGLVDEPGDFLDWCRGLGMRVEPEDHLPRRLYGVYLRQLLVRFGDGWRLQQRRARAVNVVEPLFHHGVRVTLADSSVVTADAAVLALGDPRPAKVSRERVRVELGHGSATDADVVVNATGPSWEIGVGCNPLTQRLLASGRVRLDELGLGLATGPEGALIDLEGTVSDRCFTLGPPWRGESLESTAIPEIRQQAEDLAGRLTEDGEVGRRGLRRRSATGGRGRVR
jgi:uncharacterized NAD(P)/FAD-binding protein YdhS